MHITKQISFLSTLLFMIGITFVLDQAASMDDQYVTISNLTGKKYSVKIALQGNTLSEIAEAYQKAAGLSEPGDWARVIIVNQAQPRFLEMDRKHSFEELSKVDLYATQNRYP